MTGSPLALTAPLGMAFGLTAPPSPANAFATVPVGSPASAAPVANLSQKPGPLVGLGFFSPAVTSHVPSSTPGVAAAGAAGAARLGAARRGADRPPPPPPASPPAVGVSLRSYGMLPRASVPPPLMFGNSLVASCTAALFTPGIVPGLRAFADNAALTFALLGGKPRDMRYWINAVRAAVSPDDCGAWAMIRSPCMPASHHRHCHPHRQGNSSATAPCRAAS